MTGQIRDKRNVQIETDDEGEVALKRLVTTQQLANLTGLAAKTAAVLSTCEKRTVLSRALSSLADTEEKFEILRRKIEFRHENRNRYEMANQTDKLGEAYQEVEEWQVKVQRCQQQFQEISTEIKKEMDCFELSTVKDFKNSIIRYIEDQMAHQQQVSSSIDSFYIHQ
ncbi:hypothetical protein GQX74_005613 [Glossina fuscipes]|nr:hypothetical protein GQX74_005613 [Glossina fuscipes]